MVHGTPVHGTAHEFCHLHHSDAIDSTGTTML
jgi:hypothetical protein